MSLEPVQWAIAWAAIFAGAIVQGSAGFGLAVVAAPILALVDPVFVPGPMLALAVVLSAGLAVRERHAFELGGLAWALVGRLPGTAAGAATLVVLNDELISVAVGVLVLSAVGMSMLRPLFKPTSGALFGAGLVGGFMGTVSSIGGPPMALVYQQSSGPQLRAQLSGFFTVSAAFSLAVLVVIGQFGGPELLATGTLLVPLVAGLAVSRLTAHRLDAGHTRTSVLVLSALSSAALLVRSLL